MLDDNDNVIYINPTVTAVGDNVDYALARQLIENRSIPVPEMGCWLWTEGCDNHGYGRLIFHGKNWIATRLSLLAYTGELPEGRFACHKCDVPCCVNPDHLYWGDRSQNAQDASRKGRGGRYPRVDTSWGVSGKAPKAAPAPDVLTLEYLRSVLLYEPDTGIFTWHTRPQHGLRWNSRLAGKRAGNKQGAGYRAIKLDLLLLYEHRIAWFYMHGSWPEAQIDHINGDRADNRLSNLRAATNQENGANRSKYRTNTSGFKGVSWNKQKKKWQVTITHGGKQRCVGYFDDVTEAAAAYQNAASVYFGDFASRNEAA